MPEGGGSFADIVAMTEMEQQEFRLARLKLRDQLSKQLTDVEKAIEESERSGEIFGITDLIYALSREALQAAFSEVNVPLRQAAERAKRNA